jgi:hypothetical protein
MQKEYNGGRYDLEYLQMSNLDRHLVQFIRPSVDLVAKNYFDT